MRRCSVLLFRLFFFCAALGVLAAAAAFGWLHHLVAVAPCPEMAPDKIAAILGRESPVYYRDGQEKIGVLFQEVHRQYLNYEQIPKTFVNAIVAAEDDRFFRHYGIDIPGIVRAALANLKAGRVIQGGSSITQQTVKNLFGRESRNYKAKFKEMLHALQLEHRFSKEKILEFYCNQFYVSGNGHGLGVAARYYFDKEPAELTLLENAFVAGSVKRPSYYDPFIKKDATAELRARLRAKERAEYVLEQMLRLGMISPADYDQAQKGDIMFKRGRTSFALNTVMDLIRDGLASRLVAEALAREGIDNIAASGARIVSTIDRQLQDDVLHSLRRELSRLDVELRGYGRDEVQAEYREADGGSDEEGEFREKDFVFGTIKSMDLSIPEQPFVVVAVGSGALAADGVIDRQGLERMLLAHVRHRKQQAKPSKKDLADLLGQLKPGDKVYVGVRSLRPLLLDLERYPKLQGAALVLQQGMIRAMAGGMDNRFYNRAVDARRLMGSTFKPFLFAAALQLGWSPLDRLDNRRSVFVFRDQAYFPRPDHKSPFSHVSMSWAGVKSENVASVWLLYHLTDKLTQPELIETAAALDMAPRMSGGKIEEYKQFSSRMRSQFGLHVSAGDLDSAAYELAVGKAEADFLFEGREEEHRLWREIPYGLNFEKFRSTAYGALQKPGLKPEQKSEQWQQIALLGRSYLELQRVQQFLFQYRQHVEQMSVPSFSADGSLVVQSVEGRPPGTLAEDYQGRLIYTMRSTLPETWQSVDELVLLQRLAGLMPEERDMLWNSVLLEDMVSSAGTSIVQRQLNAERSALAGQKPYAMETLVNIRDFRILVGLHYLVRLAREAGVSSPLEPVLSFPLGANVISLLDGVRMYETLATGRRCDVQRPVQALQPDEDQDGLDGLAVIDRIEGSDGRIIYARGTVARPVLDQKTSAEVSSILHNVVRYGTGHYAWENVRLHSSREEQEANLKKLDLSLPLLGKTGTANDFRNVAFLGYVPTEPAPNGAALLAASGYALGVYVGFDNNEVMQKGSLRISGALGALPAWSSIAEALYRLEGTADRLDPVDLVFDGIGLQHPDTGQIFVPVDDKGGGMMRRGRNVERTNVAPDHPAVLCHGTSSEGGSFEPERRFMPFWMNQKTVP